MIQTVTKSGLQDTVNYVNSINMYVSQPQHIYEVLDYITTPQNASMNTNVLVDETTVVEMIAQLRSRSYQGPHFFSSNDTDTDIPGWGEPGTWGLQFEDSGNNLSVKCLGDYQDVQRTGIVYSELSSRKLRYNLTASGYLNIYADDNTLYKTWDGSSYTDPTVTSSTPIKLFTRYAYHEHLTEGTYIYGVKIWKNNVLVRNYVPAKRLSDSKYGLYDLVNDTFHINDDTNYLYGGTSKSTPEYIDEQVSQTIHINRIYYNGDVYWGNEPPIEVPHTITGTTNSSFNSIYFDRQLTAPGSSSFRGGYVVPVTVNGNDWYVDTNDSPQTLVGCFANNNNITSVNIYNLDCTNLNSIENMFEYCQYMTSCDVSRLDTSNVTVMGNVFGHCSRLESLDVSSWDVSKVTRIWGMFRDMLAITSLDLSSWNTSSLTLIPHLFYNTQSIQTIDMSGWNTTLIQTTDYAFHNCTNLRTLNLSGWDLSSLTSQKNTFYDCRTLTDVYITVEATLMKLTNNLSSQDYNYIPSSATIHFNGTDYKWQNNKWTPQN